MRRPRPSALLSVISEDTGMSVETLQWAVTGGSPSEAAVIVTLGLGDEFGRKWSSVGPAPTVVSCVLIRALDDRWNGDRWAHDQVQQVRRSWLRLSLLSVAKTGEANSGRSRWRAAAAVGARRDPWSRCWWTSPDGKAGSGLTQVLLALYGADLFTVTESRDPALSRSIDYVARCRRPYAAPFILVVSKGSDWGRVS